MVRPRRQGGVWGRGPAPAEINTYPNLRWGFRVRTPRGPLQTPPPPPPPPPGKNTPPAPINVVNREGGVIFLGGVGGVGGPSGLPRGFMNQAPHPRRERNNKKCSVGVRGLDMRGKRYGSWKENGGKMARLKPGVLVIGGAQGTPWEGGVGGGGLPRIRGGTPP